MRIALDARCLYRPERRGIGKSLLRLYQELLRHRPHWEVLAYHREPGPVEAGLLSPAVTPRRVEMPGDRFEAWLHLRLPAAARADRADVLHCPANACPRWLPLPTVVTIHDLIPLEMPEGRDPRELRRFERSVRTACRLAVGVTCPSRFTAEQLVERFAADPAKLTVTPWGIDPPEPGPNSGPAADAPRRYGLTEPFVLHFGAAEPRKNTREMLEAWAMLGQAVRRRWRLLIVGLDPATRERLAGTAERLGIAQTVRLEGFVPDADAEALLAAATALAYPSRAEGFGLPVLEAFAAQTPVLIGSAGSLPEVAGDAAVRVDPEQPASIAKGLRLLLAEPLLRRELVSAGRRRLASFTWSVAAEAFAGVLESAAHRPVRAAA